MDRWHVQDAKARFSEFLEASIKKGPQMVTKRGIESAVLVPISEWLRMQKMSRPGLKEILLAPGPRFDLDLPERGNKRRRRKIPTL